MGLGVASGVGVLQGVGLATAPACPPPMGVATPGGFRVWDELLTMPKLCGWAGTTAPHDVRRMASRASGLTAATLSLALSTREREPLREMAQQLARSAGLGTPRAQPPELLGHAREQFHYL